MELQPIQEQDVYTVNYTKRYTKSAKQWWESHQIHVRPLCSLFSVRMQLFIVKWHEVKYWKKRRGYLFYREV